MVSMIINGLQLEDQSRILKADWQVSDTMNFSNIVLESLEDEMNLQGILFRDDLDPNIKYYGRVRLFIDGEGWSRYLNLDVVSVNLKGYMNQDEDLPSKIATPILETSSKYADKHDSCLFDINAKGFDIVGNGLHAYTNFLIIDINTNDVVWKKLGVEEQKDSINVNDILLEDNKVYKVCACFVSSTNDFSQLASKTIRVGGSNIDLITPVEDIQPNQENIIKVTDLTNEVNDNVFHYQLIVGEADTLRVVYEATGVNIHTLPNGTIQEGKIYILKVSNSTGSTKHNIITTF